MNKKFQEIKLFISHSSFKPLAPNTIVRLQIVRFFETLQTCFSHSWINLSVVFVLLPLDCSSFTSSLLAIQEFCSVLLLFHHSCPEYSWNRLDEVCFQLFVYGFIFSLKKWPYLKYERVLLYSNDRLVDFSSPSLFVCFFLSCIKVAVL